MPPLNSYTLLLASLVAVAGLVLVDRWARRADFAIFGLVAVRYTIGAAGGVVAASRDVPQSTFDVLTLSPAEIWLGRLSTLVFFGVVLLVVLRPEATRRGQSLWAAGMAYVAAHLVTSVLSGDGIPQEGVMLGAAFTALWVAPRLDPDVFARWTKRVLGLWMVLSAAVAAVGAPSAWEDASEASLVPLLTVRLSGITNHPNTLGPLALLFILFEIIRPSQGKARTANLALGTAMLLGSQSKTAWGAAILVALVIWWQRHPHQRANFFLAALAVVAVVPLTVASVVEAERLVDDETVERYRTLTNRTSLWDVGLAGWQERPLVGQGPLFFKRYARDSGLTWAGHAHNQYVQELSLRGLFGLVTLLLYMAVLFRVALRHSHRSGGLSLALITVVFVRTVTQVPLEELSLEHIAVFGMLMAWERTPSTVGKTELAGPGGVPVGSEVKGH